jgi:hypothetical protein
LSFRPLRQGLRVNSGRNLSQTPRITLWMTGLACHLAFVAFWREEIRFTERRYTRCVMPANAGIQVRFGSISKPLGFRSRRNDSNRSRLLNEPTIHV